MRHITRNEVISRARSKDKHCILSQFINNAISRAYIPEHRSYAGIVSRMYCKMQPSVSPSVSIIQRLSCNTLEMNLAM